jgi:tetratricopeptide (TPR) repeat protein
VLDPLSPRSHYRLGDALHFARRHGEAIAAFDESLSLDPDSSYAYGIRGLDFYSLGNFQDARASCESKPEHWLSQVCLAVTYDKLRQHGAAEDVLTKLQGSMGDAQAFQYAEIYAQWGNASKALEWLQRAVRLGDTGLVYTKTDPLLDPLRQDQRFQVVMRELKFPN